MHSSPQISEQKIDCSQSKFATALNPVHTTPEEFANGGFTLKTRQIFSVHTSPKEFKNATITGHRFRKAPFSKYFPSTRKRNAGVIKFLRFEERFPKAPFLLPVSVNGKPNRGNKAAFLNKKRSVDAALVTLNCGSSLHFII